MPQAQYPWERKVVATVQEAGWAPQPVWTEAENFTPYGFDPQIVQPVASHYIDYTIPAYQSDSGKKSKWTKSFTLPAYWCRIQYALKRVY